MDVFAEHRHDHERFERGVRNGCNGENRRTGK